MKAASTTSTAGFSLTELLFSTTISLFVVSVMLAFLIQTIQTWRDCSSKAFMTQQSRLIRERILRGIEGGYGIREASLKSLSIDASRSARMSDVSFLVDNNEWPTPKTDDDVRCDIQSTPQQALFAAADVDGGGISRLMHRRSVKVESFEVGRSNRMVETSIKLTYQIADQVFTNTQQIKTYLVNN